MQNKINLKAYLSAADKFWIGGQLRSLRQAQGLGIPEAARRTNTTQSQILAIESGSQGPFGSTENYVKGILTYASLTEIGSESALGVKLAELTNILGGSVKDQSSASGIDTLMQSSLSNSSTSSPIGKIRSKRVLLLSLGVFAIVLLALLAFDVLPVREQLKSALGSPSRTEKPENLSEAPSPVLTAITTAPASPKVESASAATNVKTTDKSPIKTAEAESSSTKDSQSSTPKSSPEKQSNSVATLINLKFTGPCWIQATAIDGKVTEKIYGASDQLELDLSKLKALVIGNVETVAVTNRQGKPLNLKTFANQSSQVARLKEQELSALTRERN